MIFDAIIISDIHLGSDLCQADKLLHFLTEIKNHKIKTEMLVLNGDVFDSHDFSRLKKSHWKVLSLIRKISGNTKLVWVVGNHDGPVDILSNVLGIEVVSELEVKSGHKDILIVHGDEFDEIMSKYPFLAKWADLIYRWMTRRFPKCVCRSLKKSSKTYSRAIEIVKEKAIAEGKRRKIQAVICGHVHMAESDYNSEVEYHNSGSWTEEPCTFISVKSGAIKTNHYESN